VQQQVHTMRLVGLLWLAAVLVNISAVIYVGVTNDTDVLHPARPVLNLITVTDLKIDEQPVARDGKPIELVAGEIYEIEGVLNLNQDEFIPTDTQSGPVDMRIVSDPAIRNLARRRGKHFQSMSIFTALISSNGSINSRSGYQLCVTKTTGLRTATITAMFEVPPNYGERFLIFSLDELEPLADEVYFDSTDRTIRMRPRAIDRFPIVIVAPPEGDDAADEP
jgi:hypothetical protein